MTRRPKVLLVAINAKYIHSNPAIYSLRGYAKKYREHIELGEYTINHREPDILADIYKRQPDVIAFSCYIWNWVMIHDLIIEIHKIMPKVSLWLGGPEATYDAEAMLQALPMLAGVMVGEGEATFLEIMEHYVKGSIDIRDIKGLVTNEGRNQERALTDLSEIPFLYENLEPFTNRILYYESSRGCPFRCSYCLSSIDKEVRLRDLGIVKKELQFFLDKKVSQVKFVDRTFNCNHNHAMAIWSYIHENDNRVTNFHFEVSADIIQEEALVLLNSMRPGLVQLEIGVQSTNVETISAICRSMNVDKLRKIVERIHQGKNIHQHLDLIAGLPFEDYQSFSHSFNEVYDMRPEQLQLGFLKVLKGSLMYEKVKEYQLKYTDKPPYEVLSSKWLSYGDILKLKAIEEMVEIYYNSNQYTHILPLLAREFKAPFELFEALALYYESEGYFLVSPSRAYRYGILLQFAIDVNSSYEELFKELLTFDMYLRENLKSRPSFAIDLNLFKEEIREFYQREAVKFNYLIDYQDYDRKQISKMTHLERFTYPVWEENIDNITSKLAMPEYMLFDYIKRDALTHQATWWQVSRT